MLFSLVTKLFKYPEEYGSIKPQRRFKNDILPLNFKIDFTKR